MAGRAAALRVVILRSLLALAVTPVSAQAPEGVSPGAVDRVTAVELRCPTFTWGAVPEAAAYELVVYRLPEEPGPDGAELRLEPSDQALFARLPGGATAWQPSLADGLEPGASYVWFVRAVLKTDTGEASEWSAGRFFEVAAAPSAREVEQALEVLQRWDAANRNRPLTLSSAIDPDADAAPAAVSDTEADEEAAARHPKSVPTATAAIRGSSPDATGEVYGVVGISASPDGAGLAAANTAGGPDLVLDGSAELEADARINQAGIDRAAASPQTFSFNNTGGGGIAVDIDGVEVVTTATDHDTLGSLSCSDGELAKWNGSQWVCETDIDFDTLGALACGSGQVAKWNGSAWECAPDVDTNTDTLAGLGCETGQIAKWLFGSWTCTADNNTLAQLGCTTDQIAKYDGTGWVCAADNDTTYDPGSGLILDNGQLRIDPAAFTTRISTVDSASPVGLSTSIAIGTDGLGLISCYDGASQNLKVAHCNDEVCSSATTTVIGNPYNDGLTSSITIGGDGFGLISYYDDTNDDLWVAHCANTACTGYTRAIVYAGGNVGMHSSITTGTDGLGLISYYDDTNHDLRVAHCSNVLCSNAPSTTIDSTGSVGTSNSITIGADGFGLISYYDSTNHRLKVAHCTNTACTAATTSSIDSTAYVGRFTSITIGADGLGLISYFDETNGDLKVAHCSDTACSSAAVPTLDTGGTVGWYTSIAIGADGLGLVSYYDLTNSDLKVAHCNDLLCTNATITTVESFGFVGEYSAIAIGADGLGLISYFDAYFGHLKVAHLGIGVP
jgi:preprotein translocase subunit Sec61beta